MCGGTQARGYSHGTDQTDISLSIVFATANIVSTASDVQRFAQAVVDGELLQPDTGDPVSLRRHGKGQYNIPDLAYGEGIIATSCRSAQAPMGKRAPPRRCASASWSHREPCAGPTSTD